MRSGEQEEEEQCSPPQVENGWVRGEGDGDIWVGEFACNPGYILLGTHKIKCRAGTWSSDIPKCSGKARERGGG